MLKRMTRRTDGAGKGRWPIPPGPHARRALAAALALCMMLTLLPAGALAADTGEPTEQPVLITAFDELDEAVRSQTAPLGTALEDLALPDGLAASGYKATEEPEPEAAPLEIQGVAWQSEPGYDGDAPATYTFTAVLPQGYTMAAGVSLPQIAVTVEEGEEADKPEETGNENADEGAAQAVAALIEALPTAAEMAALLEGAPQGEGYESWLSQLDGAKQAIGTAITAYNALDEAEQGAVAPELAEKLAALTGALRAGTQRSTPRSGENAPTVDGNTIYANGTPLLIVAGSDAEKTTIYVDANGNGKLDDEETAVVENADLSHGTIYGGCKETAYNGATQITLTGGKVQFLYGGGAYGEVTGNPTITMTGGEVDYLFGGGELTVTGNASITVTGGKVGLLNGGGAYDAINGVSTVTVGDSAKVGCLSLNGGTYKRGVGSFAIHPVLTEGAAITIDLPANYDASGAPTVATGATADDLQYLTLTGGGAAGKRLVYDSGAIKVKLPDAPVVSGRSIHANGTPLLITEGSDEGKTTVYADANGNGERDAGETAVVENADLSNWMLYGGCQTAAYNSKTQIIMTGGKVANLYGGGVNGTVAGGARVAISGGEVGSLCGGGITGTVTNGTQITVSGGNVGSVCGGGQNGTVKGGTEITVKGGTVESLYGGGGNATVQGDVRITVTGGEVGALYGGGRTTPANGTATVTISGEAKVGRAGKGGVIINGGSINRGVNSLIINGNSPLTGGGLVYINLPSGFDGNLAATVASVTEKNFEHLSISGPGAVGMQLVLEGEEIKVKKAEAPTVWSNFIYANGTPLLITEGSDAGKTTVYADANGNGQLDTGETAVVENADLSGWTIYGGCDEGALHGNPTITMTGGAVKHLYGGGMYGTVTGSPAIAVTGGAVQQLYGGGMGGAVTGTPSVTVGGEAKVGDASTTDGGIFFNSASRDFGVDSLTIVDINPLRGEAMVTINLPADYDASGEPTVATDVLSSDLKYMALSGPGAAEKWLVYKDLGHGRGAIKVTQVGMGTEEAPYLISSYADLAELAKAVNGGKSCEGLYFRLADSFDTDRGVVTTAIGDAVNNMAFSGYFDGNGKTIKLHIDAEGKDGQGLFGFVRQETATSHRPLIQNVTVSGTVTGKTQVGGVVGFAQGGDFVNCVNTATITAKGGNAGGVAGRLSRSDSITSTMTGCYNTGVVTGGESTGGVVGENTGTVEHCYNTGAVTGGENTGGVVGTNSKGGSVSHCLSLGLAVTGSNVNSTYRVAGYNAVDGVEPTNSGVLAGNYARLGLELYAGGYVFDVSCLDGGHPNGLNLKIDGTMGQADAFAGWEATIWDIPDLPLENGRILPTLRGAPQSPAPRLPGAVPHTDHDASVECGSEHPVVYDKALTSKEGALYIGEEAAVKDDSNGYILPTGNYYLAGDVELNRRLYINGENTAVNLCLNGQTLSTTQQGVYTVFVDNGASLSVCDCKGTGAMTYPGGAAIVVQKGTLTFYGGRINAQEAGIRCGGEAEVSIHGGDVTANIALEVSGAATVTGGTFAGKRAVMLDSKGNLTVTGGTFTGEGEALRILPDSQTGEWPPVALSGGTFQGGTESAFRSGNNNTPLTSTSVANMLQAGYRYEDGSGNPVAEADLTAAKTLVVAPKPYALTVKEGGQGATASGEYAPGATVAIQAGSRDGYRFTGWTASPQVEFADAGSANTTFTMPEADVTVTAGWESTSSGGDDGGNDDDDNGNDNGNGGGNSSGGNNQSGTGTVTTEPGNQTGGPTTAETNVEATVNQEGQANVTLPGDAVGAAIEKAAAEAKKNGTEEQGVRLRVNVSTGGKNADSITVNLPKVTQEHIITHQVKEFTVVVDRPDISLSLSLESVQAINQQANADVQLSAARIDGGSLSDAAREAIGERPAFQLTAAYEGGKQVKDFGGGSVTVAFPYTLQAGEAPGGVMAVYVDENGEVHYLPGSAYGAVRGAVQFKTGHFSAFGVGYKAAPAFADTQGHWAQDDIGFVAARGLLQGTGESTYSPDTAMTRGMFVTALGRLAGVDASGYQAKAFNDVNAEAYYAQYVEWAASKNIVLGIGGGAFAPERTVTRQEMAAIMQRYATAMGYKLPVNQEATAFEDSGSIGAWAKDAVTAMQRAGVLQGQSGNRFAPTSPATRAEAAAVLRRYVELVLAA